MPLPGDLIFQAVMHHDGSGLGTKYALASEGPREGYRHLRRTIGARYPYRQRRRAEVRGAASGRSAHISRAEEGIDTLPVAIEVYRGIAGHTFAFSRIRACRICRACSSARSLGGEAPAAVADTDGYPRRSADRAGDGPPGGAGRDLLDRGGGPARRMCVHGSGLSPHISPSSASPMARSWTRSSRLTRQCAARRRASPMNCPGRPSSPTPRRWPTLAWPTVVYGASRWHLAPDEYVDLGELADSARVYLAVAATLGAGAEGLSA